MGSGGFLSAFLLVLVLLPSSIWFVVKFVRAAYYDGVKKDFIDRPIFHIVWGVASIISMLGVLSQLSAILDK